MNSKRYSFDGLKSARQAKDAAHQQQYHVIGADEDEPPYILTVILHGDEGDENIANLNKLMQMHGGVMIL